MKAKNMLNGAVEDFGWVLWVSPSRKIPRTKPNNGDDVKRHGFGETAGFHAWGQKFVDGKERWFPVEVES